VMVQAEVQKGRTHPLPARLRVFKARATMVRACTLVATIQIWQMRLFGVMACCIRRFARLRNMC
jgi:hypothetical protein